MHAEGVRNAHHARWIGTQLADGNKHGCRASVVTIASFIISIAGA